MSQNQGTCVLLAGEVLALSRNQIFHFSLGGTGGSKLLSFSWALVLENLCSLEIVPLI